MAGQTDATDGNMTSDGALNADQRASLDQLTNAFHNAQKMAMKSREINVREQAQLDADKKMPH